MRVVLALCPVWESVTPNLALAYLKGSLHQSGYECKTFDFSAQFRPVMVSVLGDRGAEEYVRNHPKLYRSWAKQIATARPDVVGFSMLASNLANTALVAKELRLIMPEVMIIAGGPSLTPENSTCIADALTYCNYVIEGEGEQAIVDFVKCHERKGDYKQLKQIWYSDESGKPLYTGHQPLQNINNVAYPDFTDFDRKAYPSPNKLPLLFSRGCILNCNYCENKWNHLTQRSREGKNVFEELKHHVKKYNIKEYMFNDDSLISSKTLRQLEEYCDLVLAEDLAMPWSVYGTRVERLITQPFLNKLRRSGMERVSLGVESFSSRVQKEMGKSSRYDDADKMCRMFANEGIRTESWIIYGYPTETDEDFNETLNWFVQNPNVLSHVTVNAFGPNAKYLHDRPGVIRSLSNISGHWEGLESTLEKRKQRFLLLIEVLESIRQSRKGAFTYHFGDPLYVKYFNSWTSKDKQLLFDAWERIEDPIGYTIKKNNTAINRLLKKLGLGDHEMAPAVVPPRKPLDKPVLYIGELSQMQQQLFTNIENHLKQSSQLTHEEILAKLHFYKQVFENVKPHLNDNVTEGMMYAMALTGPVGLMLNDLDTHAPEYIAQKTVESTELFELPVSEYNS